MVVACAGVVPPSLVSIPFDKGSGGASMGKRLGNGRIAWWAVWQSVKSRLKRGIMNSKMTRRDALKLGTGTALSAALAQSASGAGRSTAAGPATPNPGNEICFMRAVDMVEAIRTKKLSARELMQAHLQQIQRVNTSVNAMVTMVAEEQLMAQAAAADEALAHGKWLGPLHGLPVAVKDLHETSGIRTTYGSPLHKNYVPDFDCRVVQREKEAGAIVLGKTNVPEFGLGSQTFNPVFGPTHNPYDITKTCGGSTGGGAVAVACGMAPLADGSDMGGSLRNPPNFCNVVGIRTSPGRVSNVPTDSGLVHAFGSRTRGSQCHRLCLFPERARRIRPSLPDLD